MNRKERRAMKSKVRKTKIRLLTAHAMGLKHEEAVVSIAWGPLARCTAGRLIGLSSSVQRLPQVHFFAGDRSV